MSGINNIDELLKNSFEHFEANPPANVWNGIQQNMPHGGSSVAGNAAVKSAAIKSTGIITKVVVGIVSGASIMGGVYLVSKITDKKPNKQETTISSNNTIKPETKNAEINDEKRIENKFLETQKVKTKNQPTEVNTNEILPSNKINDGSNTNSQNTINQTTVKKENAIGNSTPKPNTSAQPAIPKPKHDFNNSQNQTIPEELVEEKPTIPNVFTPNNDGKNDQYEIKIENESLYDLKIYDKDENLVFESNSKEKTWDGTKFNSGENCDPGTYIGVFRYQYNGSEKSHQTRLVINLIR